MSFDNNKDNPEQKKKKSLYQFLDKEGFYLIMLLCVGLVAATALWASRQNQDPLVLDEPPIIEENLDARNDLPEGEPEDSEPTGAPAKVGQEQEQEQELPKGGTEVEENQKLPDTEIQQGPSDLKEQETLGKQTPEEKPPVEVMTLPVLGKLGLGYADDELVYHKTLDQWSTHKGIDIHADLGTPVRAALAGEVIEVVEDPHMGITITLQHEGDLLTRYSNLSTDTMVKVGDLVEKGQVISGVGNTAQVKLLEGPLVHFQVILEGKTVDPANYLPKLK